MFSRSLARFRRRAAMLAVRLRSKRENPAILSTGTCWDGVQRCLVCWIDRRVEPVSVRLVVERLRSRFPGVQIVGLTLPELRGGASDDLFDSTLRIEKGELNFLGLPTGHFRRRLRGLSPDVAVDLSAEFSPLASYLCMLSEARIKVGFAVPGGELVYNWQVAPRGDRRGVERYRVLARYIG